MVCCLHVGLLFALLSMAWPTWIVSSPGLDTVDRGLTDDVRLSREASLSSGLDTVDRGLTGRLLPLYGRRTGASRHYRLTQSRSSRAPVHHDAIA